MKSKGVKALKTSRSRDNESIGNGTIDSPKKNLARRMQIRSEKSATKIAAKNRRQTQLKCKFMEARHKVVIILKIPISVPLGQTQLFPIIYSSFVSSDRRTRRSVPTFLGILVVLVILVRKVLSV